MRNLLICHYYKLTQLLLQPTTPPNSATILYPNTLKLLVITKTLNPKLPPTELMNKTDYPD